MSKSSNKRGFPKLAKLGKYFKLKRSSKKKKSEQETPGVQNGGPSTPTCVLEYTTLPDGLIEERSENSTIDLKEDKPSTEEEINCNSCDVKEKIPDQTVSETVTIDNGQHVEDNGSSNPVVHEEKKITTADIIVHSSAKDNFVQEQNLGSEKSPLPSTLERKADNSTLKLVDKLSESETSQHDVQEIEEYPEELVYPVLIKTPFQKQKSEAEIEMEQCKALNENNANGQHIPCTVVVHTPVKKQLINGDTSKPTAKATVDDDDDIVLMEMPQTPLPKKPHNKDCRRVSTVKKIRSIIATPYKRLKRDSSSLMDGHTYRYIEIQSLVNAFQTLHACKGGMMACNEKGLQYGKSSVLRIECQDCNTKVFLQATKS